jgi:uncharacterized membrane protein
VREGAMSKGRLEAFSDAVIAIAMTIMVLELQVPHEPTFQALQELWPVFFSYVLSFVHLGIYWNNHHHMLQVGKVVDGRVLWANLHLLFWLTLVPFATAWMGETSFAALPTAAYGTVLFFSAVAYTILVVALIRAPGQHEALAEAIGSDRKGRSSLLGYLVAIPVAFVAPLVSLVIYVVVAAQWFVPDRRMERALGR